MTDYRPDCGCRSDKVCCFWHECPRTASIQKQQAEQYRQTIRIVGDQREGVQAKFTKGASPNNA